MPWYDWNTIYVVYPICMVVSAMMRHMGANQAESI